MAGNCTPALCRGAGSYIVRRQAGCSDPCCLKLILKRPSNRLLFGKHHSSLILQPLMIRCGAIINFMMNSGASLSGPKAVWRVGGGLEEEGGGPSNANRLIFLSLLCCRQKVSNQP